jgi:hypothetical protein
LTKIENKPLLGSTLQLGWDRTSRHREVAMSKYLPASLGVAAFFVASTALAIERSGLEKSSIKAATDCVAQAALKNPDIITLHRQNRLNELTDSIVLRSNVCDKPLTAMRLLHDRIYGKGSGQLFLQGAFLADLPRAVGERIGIELANRALQSPEISRSFGRAYPGPYDRGQWNHNGSLMTLVEGENNSRAIYYQFPRSTMADIGAREGTLLFRGYETDGRWFGIAYVFKLGCPPIPYRVEGNLYSNDRGGWSVHLRGPAPAEYIGCDPISYAWTDNSDLIFDYLNP